MKVFVINLARSVDRREQMTKKLEQAKVTFEFFQAVDASLDNFSLSERAAPEITIKRKGYTLLPSEIGCYASHYLLWEKCIELNEPIVILEDNIDLVDDFKEILTKLVNYSLEYSYIKLSATKPRKFREKLAINDIYSLGTYDKGTCGTTGYIISPLAAKKFIQSSNKFIEPVDDFMEKPWIHKVQAYSIYPSICNRANIQSTIGLKRKNKTKINFKNKIFVELYRLYEDLMKKIYWHK